MNLAARRGGEPASFASFCQIIAKNFSPSPVCDSLQAWRETDESNVDHDPPIADLLTGRAEALLRVLACSAFEAGA